MGNVCNIKTKPEKVERIEITEQERYQQGRMIDKNKHRSVPKLTNKIEERSTLMQKRKLSLNKFDRSDFNQQAEDENKSPSPNSSSL